jgi:1-acyl-sn-glycerol-3-phosphate acyltransferase
VVTLDAGHPSGRAVLLEVLVPRRPRTLYDLSVVVATLRTISGALLRLRGWRVEGQRPDAPRFVVVAAPHTSAWDVPLMITAALQVGIRLHWLGASWYFRWPVAGLMRWLGGVPIDRGRTASRVRTTAELMAAYDHIGVAISPEGSRKLVPHWRSGFYHLAVAAEVPIVLTALDHRRRRAVIGPALVPTGDIEADLATIAAFYDGVEGRYPDQQGPVAVAPRHEVA